MLSSRLFQSLFAIVVAILVFGVATPAAACCGETPDWWLTAFVDGTPSCSNRLTNGGSVRWHANYHLNSAVSHTIHVHIFGDGVITNNSGAPLQHTPGSQVDTYSRTSTWQWDPNYDGTTRTVRVQIDMWGWDDYVDGAMIRITCTSRGLMTWEIENWEGHIETYGG